MLKIVIPLSKAMLEPPPTRANQTLGGNVNIVDDEENAANQPPSGAETLERKLGQARDLAQQDPKVVANIIKDWTNANAS